MVPQGFLPQYFAGQAQLKAEVGLGERDMGEVVFGLWRLQLAEFRAQGANSAEEFQHGSA